MMTRVTSSDIRQARLDRSYGRVLVATAGEPESRGALNVAAALSARRGAAVVALGVTAPFPHNLSTLVSVGEPAAIDEEARQALLTRMRQAVAHIPQANSWDMRATVGMPADVILMAAASLGAELIVMGSGRHGRIDRVFGTETAIAVIKRARVPVLVVPAEAEGLPRRAVAALDFTAASFDSAVQAGRLLSDNGTLFAVHVRGFSGAQAKPGDIIDVYRAGAQAKIDEAVAELRSRLEIQVEPALLDGDPGKAIVTFARENHCDLIALGGHHMGLMDRVLLGSVRTRVVRNAPCDVLIAPPESADASSE